MEQVIQEHDEHWMREALSQAAKADAANEVPVGAVVVLEDEVIGYGWNQPISGHDPTAHAEIRALQMAAAHVENYRLVNADLYVTIEPCTMCAGAIVHARIRRVIFGAYEPKAGAVVSNAQVFEQAHMNYQVDYTPGVLANECSAAISTFFQRRRSEKKAARQAAREAVRADQSVGGS